VRTWGWLSFNGEGFDYCGQKEWNGLSGSCNGCQRPEMNSCFIGFIRKNVYHQMHRLDIHIAHIPKLDLLMIWNFKYFLFMSGDDKFEFAEKKTKGNQSIFVDKFSFRCFTIYEISMVCPLTLIGKTKNIEKIVSLLC